MYVYVANMYGMYVMVCNVCHLCDVMGRYVMWCNVIEHNASSSSVIFCFTTFSFMKCREIEKHAGTCFASDVLTWLYSLML